ncbi:neutral/alkaline non-lysosomal ceramidase N-terminal domain-containing protein [Paenibacillus oryzisoli]|uniref:neutral/alkaline non-lysosomal ceramidase N-terminal domain-containing protein n=1 Tax=Paenibacillus oryzisoli TaxID=1850517 RepID=UPI003D29F452
MNNQLLLGTSKMNITPKSPVPLAGFEKRKGVFEGIRKPLYARCWLFQQASSNGSTLQSLFVQADIIWWGTERVEALKQRIQQEYGIASIVLHATHTHTGPQTSELFIPSLGEYDETYVRMMEEKLLQGISAAKANMDPVHIERGRGSCRIGIHRRKRVNDRILMKPNEDGEFDPEVHAFRFVKYDGKVKGVMFHYTCHPTTTKENYVSPEFPGIAMELVEERYGNAAIASYLQGCCGDVRPALIQDEEFIDGTFQDVDELGQKLGREVLHILEAPMERLAPNLQALQRKSIVLPIAALPDEQELARAEQREGAIAEWGRLLLDHPSRVQPHATLEMSLMRIANGLAFLGLNGEPVLRYGLTVKALSGGQVLPLGYTDGMIGYIPTAAQLEEGGYESIDSHYYFGLAGPFAPEAETVIMEQLRAMLGGPVYADPLQEGGVC